MKVVAKYWWIIKLTRKIYNFDQDNFILVAVFSDKKNLAKGLNRQIRALDKKAKSDLVWWEFKECYQLKIRFCLSVTGKKMKFPADELEKILYDTSTQLIKEIGNKLLYQEQLKEDSAKFKKKKRNGKK